MGKNTPRQEFEEKAPLVDVEELTDLILEGMLTEELRERAVGVCVRGSFADPDRDIDTSETASDLDVFVLVPDWKFPVTDTGIALVAPQTDVPDPFEASVANASWTSPDGKWDSAEQAWEQLPEYVCETLRNSMNYGFCAREEDVEEGRVRPYDVTIGNHENYGYVEKPSAELWIYGEGP